jgi:hypothetical protein
LIHFYKRMKATILVLLCTLGLTLAQGQGGGFLDGLTNTFNNLFGSALGQQRPRQRPRPPPRIPQRPQNPFQEQLDQFEVDFQPLQPLEPGFQPHPEIPLAPQFVPDTSSSSPRPVFTSSTLGSTAPSHRVVEGTSLCDPVSPNHFWTDPRDGRLRGYIATWKNGCSSFEQHEAKEYCNSMEMEPVSLDSPEKVQNINQLMAQDGQGSFWTGGMVDDSNSVVTWTNLLSLPVPIDPTATITLQRAQRNVMGAGRHNQHHHTELCLQLLNDEDGINWNQADCHQKKATICEPRT